MAAVYPSRAVSAYGSSPLSAPSELRQRDSASPVSSYGDDADELMETDKEDELTSEVDRSFSQTLSVSDNLDAFEPAASPLSKTFTTTANKRRGMTLPRKIPSMLHGADDDDDDDENDDDVLHGTGYFGARAPISPTGGARLARQPALGQASRARNAQLSSRLGQLQQRPSAFSTANPQPVRAQRAFGQESGRDNILRPNSQNESLTASSAKSHSQTQTEIGFAATLRAATGNENGVATFRPKSRPALPTFTMSQRPSPKRGDVSSLSSPSSRMTDAHQTCLYLVRTCSQRQRCRSAHGQTCGQAKRQIFR